MQSIHPMPGNPWPHEMIITIEDDLQALLDLLWIREAWGLHPVGDDLPPFLSEPVATPPTSAAASDRIATWRAAWAGIWKSGVQHAGLIRDSTVFERLRGTPGGSPEREQLLHELFGPSWQDRFGDEALGDAHAAWAEARFDAESRRRRDSLEEQPERVSLAALIPAWRAGLSKIVTIPCQGEYTRIIGAHTLMMTEETRRGAQSYSEALARFR